MSIANVVLLGVYFPTEGRRFDAPAKLIGSGRGTNALKFVVELNGVKIHVDGDQIMDAEQYFKLYNSDQVIPNQRAVGELWFTESQYAGTIDSASKGDVESDK